MPFRHTPVGTSIRTFGARLLLLGSNSDDYMSGSIVLLCCAASKDHKTIALHDWHCNILPVLDRSVSLLFHRN